MSDALVAVRRSAPLMLLLVFLLAAPAFCAGPIDAAKVAITDGSVFHDVGDLQCNLTNWGLIGSQYSTTLPWSGAPSCRWPGAAGREHLWSGGLWVGAVRLGEQCVSTAQFESEFLPDPGPLAILRAASAAAPGAARYPAADADDDGDGLVDEDPLDGVDNDADGAIDEDFAAWGDQYFRCEYDDVTQTAYPDHVPLGLRVVQETVQWADPLHGSAIGLEYTLVNEGVVALEDVFCSFFADPDIAATDGLGESEDDRVGVFEGLVDDDGYLIPVEMGYAYDSKPGAASGYLGVLALGVRHGELEGDLYEDAPGSSIQLFSGQMSFINGGDPTNDVERYSLMTATVSDAPPAAAADYRLLVSAGPFGDLAPGESLTVRFALVAGADRDALLANAGRFRRAYLGAAFDRDGDPANGSETVVRWLRPEDVPVPALTGRLTVVEARDDRVRLDLDTNVDDLAGLVLERETPVAAEARRWNAARLAVDGGAALLDAEPASWPRTYRLLLQTATGDLTLDTIRLAPPAPAADGPELFAAPNPFNPSLTVEYRLAEPGRAVLKIYDVAGRLVARLDEGPREAGSHVVQWDGRDVAGRAAPSGAYHLRLEAGGIALGRTVSLVR